MWIQWQAANNLIVMHRLSDLIIPATIAGAMTMLLCAFMNKPAAAPKAAATTRVVASWAGRDEAIEDGRAAAMTRKQATQP